MLDLLVTPMSAQAFTRALWAATAIGAVQGAFEAWLEYRATKRAQKGIE